MHPHNDNKLITAKEAAHILGFKTDQTVYRWAQRGLIKKHLYGSRCIRFKQDEIEEIAKNGFPAEPELNLEVGNRMPKTPARFRPERRPVWEK